MKLMKQMKQKLLPVMTLSAVLLLGTGTFAACVHDLDHQRSEYIRVSDELHTCIDYYRCTLCGETLVERGDEEHTLVTEEEYNAPDDGIDDEDGEIDDGSEEDYDDSDELDDDSDDGDDDPEEFIYTSISETQHAYSEVNICEQWGAKVVIKEVEDHDWGDEYDKIKYESVSSKEHVCKKYYHCLGCNKQKVISKNQSHSYGSWKTIKEATVLKTGKKERKCSRCSKKETAVIPKLKATIKLSATKKTIKLSKSYVLKITKLAKGDAVKSVISSKKKNVQIKKLKTNQYKIVAKKKGTTVITVLLKSGKKATCNITVK